MTTPHNEREALHKARWLLDEIARSRFVKPSVVTTDPARWSELARRILRRYPSRQRVDALYPELEPMDGAAR